MGFRRLVFQSLLAGLCPLIPIPFLDDWAHNFLRRRLAADLVRSRGAGARPLGDAELRVLACGEPPDAGVLRGCLVPAFLKALFVIGKKLFKKLFRKILFVLAIKDCVTSFARAFHEAYLLRHAVGLGELQGPADVSRVRHAIEEAQRQLDLGPVERLARRTLGGSWRLVKASAVQLARGLRRLRRRGGGEPDPAGPQASSSPSPQGAFELDDLEETLHGVVDELTDGLRQESGYLAHLEELLEKHLVPPPPLPEGDSPSASPEGGSAHVSG